MTQIQRRSYGSFSCLGLVSLGVFLSSCGKEGSEGSAKEAPVPAKGGMITAPGLENRTLIAPLADAWSRIDAAKDGWASEAQGAEMASRLKRLAKAMAHPMEFGEGDLVELLASARSEAGTLRPENPVEVYRNAEFTVRRGSFEGGGKGAILPALRGLLAPFDASADVQTELKLYRIEMLEGTVRAGVIVHFAGAAEGGRLQINSEWVTTWSADALDPKLLGIEATRYEEVLRCDSERAPLFADATASVLGETVAYREQFLRSTDYWRARLARDNGLDVVANHGLALGDVNGDGLDDLYVCQQGGLPNRMFVREESGALRDITAESGTGWIDYCASALILDFDNDGDRDLAVSQDFKILFMDNLGGAKFELALGLGTKAQTFSIAAADYDLDGDLDLYLCGYNPAADRGETGAMGSPMPYHDARNGGKNLLFRNEGNWEFVDVTAEVGLDQNNDRFSFAAVWEDYDGDGDADLYVSNDYGRNNFYRNDGGKFSDVAAALGVEDMSAGMSSSWGDYNRDGTLDLYVSNMFSAAGNRITYQRQFKEGAGAEVLAEYRRHARGNSLFEGSPGGGPFRDVSEASGVTMGRWAWGSRFADLDNDGWQDLVVANGFISAPDTGDL
jgi:hypothetical protein